MKTSDMIQSKYLKKEDFDTPAVLTIKDCSLEEVGKGEERWVLFFKERAKGVVLNVTKIRLLEKTYGQDTDEWIGKRVKLYHDPDVTFGTQIVGGIGMKVPKADEIKKPAPATATNDEFDDREVPF